jgi:hypothetical protein
MGLPHLQYQHNQDFKTASSTEHAKDANQKGEWNWSTTDEVMLPNVKEDHFKDSSSTTTWKDTSDNYSLSLNERTDKIQPANTFRENTIFDTYQKKLQNSRSDLFNPERVSRMVHTTAMTM